MFKPALAILLGLASTASADGNVYSGRFGLHFTRVPAGEKTPAANTHIIFMNKCTGGCTVHVGNPDNRTDTSDIPSQTGTLTQFNQSAAVWNQVMSCMRDTFSRFNVQIVDTDPGQTPHFEVMVAGIATQILGAQGQGIGGIADFPCSQIGQCDEYMPNALVFAFANDPYYQGAPLEICSTAAQEIAHTWALDHVVDATDPMTYNPFNGMRDFKDAQHCGSDCQGGQSPFGLTCTGSGGQATHTCSGTGTATQNEVATITSLFGANAPDTTPPTVQITSPSNGASVLPGFGITATITDDNSVASATLKIDGAAAGTLTGAPFVWNAPQTLSQGSHHVEVSATDLAGNAASSAIDVTYGSVCHQNSDCMDPKQICDNGHCIMGPGSPGGLGSPCNAPADCASNQCADDGAGHKYCTEPCTPTANMCPAGFDCIAAGAGGLCWPGANNGGGGGGGCTTSGNGGALLVGLGFASLFLRGRRRSLASRRTSGSL